MQNNSMKLARTTSVPQKVREVSVRLSIAAAILGSSVVGGLSPAIVRAQESGVPRYYGPYSPETYEAFVAAHRAVTIGEDFSRYEPNLYLDYLAQISPQKANDQSAEFNPNSSGAAYRPYVPSIGHNDQLLLQVVATPEPVDLMGAVYADSQTPIEQQTHRAAVQTSGPSNAPATPIASVDLMRGVYGDNANLAASQVEGASAASDAPSAVAPIPYRSPVLPDQNDGRDNLVITPDGWFEAPNTVVVEIDGVDQLRYVYENGHVSVDVLNNMLLAQGRAPVVARPPVSRALARGVIGDELFLYSVTVSPVAEENEPSQMQAIVPSHSGLAM